ncbi:hypothetical protein [Arenimonas terrae]|jgi:rubrerythrin|uniref:DUF892 family protein n=1 Tax=Arenimonas terrae TaxID=2546226 RepID=A0A5C4RQ21_9GAMM|nr:hypothetical protein [Arenimonas terrae]TNJ33252.1 hypothetical protein E1B00_13215 [Arenimonas terrae]
MAKKKYDRAQLEELLLQALETELGGIEVYTAAIECAVNDDLREEWQEYLEQTRRHHEVLINVFEQVGLDPEQRSPGREVVAHIGKSLVQAIEMARESADAEAAQLVAGECVVLAETKDHQNWELIGLLAEKGSGDETKVLQQAYDAVAKDEHHHLLHTTGWTRELWIQSLGLPAVLPPPEEVKHVETKIGASRAEQARDEMLKKH